MKSALLLQVLALFLLGCAGLAKRPLVLGLYDVPQEALPQVKEAGFDVVTGEAKASFLDAAHKAELKVLATSSVLIPEVSGASVLDELQKFDRHPALWGWYLTDEPDVRDVPPQTVDAAARFVQSRTQRPGVVTLASGNAARLYGRECDLLFVDFYPVPWAPVSRFAKEMRMACAARGEKPYCAVVQAFDWTHFSDVLGQTNNLRLPTIAEVRCMAYVALALEARGLFFYSHTTRSWRLAESALWPELKTLLAEVRRVAPIFDDGPVWFPSEFEYHDPSRMYNEVHEGAILPRLFKLSKKTSGLEPGYYFVLINTTGEAVGYDIRLPFMDVDVVRVGKETLVLEEGWLRRTYAAYEVVVVGPITSKPVESMVEHGLFR